LVIGLALKSLRERRFSAATAVEARGIEPKWKVLASCGVRRLGAVR
jgi:hypothetical protein